MSRYAPRPRTYRRCVEPWVGAGQRTDTTATAPSLESLLWSAGKCSPGGRRRGGTGGASLRRRGSLRLRLVADHSEEMTFSDKEIDRLLPSELKRAHSLPYGREQKG